MNNSPRDTLEIDATFQKAEEQGLKIAIRGKVFAIVLLVLYLISSRSLIAAPGFILAGALFVAFGILHHRIIGNPQDRPWMKFVFLTIDIVLLSILVAVGPADLQHDLPKAMIFRFDVFIYYFLLIAVAGFSFSPGLMLWAGVAGSLGWLSAYQYIQGKTGNTLQWSDIPSEATREEFLAVFLSPDFLPFGSRVQEALVLIVTAALLSLVMRRARKTVYAHIEAEAERRKVRKLFGRHVPRAVADLMISTGGELIPTEREATILFADIADFTTLTEKLGPAGITNVLNAYFDDAENIISAKGGIITQFQGDAILAVFNLPAKDANHPLHALQAGILLLEQVRKSTYDGVTISIRIGINTGKLIAGNVGGGGRENYTVHGDAVNAAARLEALNKELGTQLLVSESTLKLVGDSDLKYIATVNLRGQSMPVRVFTPQHS